MEKTATETVTEVRGVSKTYGKRTVVDDVSFAVYSGDIFGLIGPNGAGKTTIIRMMMDIIKPDSGEISILGESLSEETKNSIGYLPEERGLYRKLTVVETLVYLASLKGKNVIHQPRLIVLDEPFSGLDPVNTELLKEIIKELRERDATFIFSTHQMNQVEELCDRFMMINHGRSVLYGNLADVKARYRSNSVIVDSPNPLGVLKGVAHSESNGSHNELFLQDGASPEDILRQLVESNVPVERFEIATPSLNQIFLQVAGEKNE
jgi:ABC-2 type transport system ATP-binding protein